MAKRPTSPTAHDDAVRVTDHVSNWFAGERATQVVRRHEVWGLLGWYHHKVVEPQLGLAGLLRRWWWRATGQLAKLSPWRDLEERKERVKAHRALMAAIARGEHRTASPAANPPPSREPPLGASNGRPMDAGAT